MTTTPNFFLVGAARAGTTSLYEYLRSHPDIFMPATLQGKEPSFFCELTPPWAREYRTFDEYLSLFKGGARRRAVGEASTNYLCAPEAAERLQRRFPDAKILILLRNPVDRAYSLWRYICFFGLEWITPFERALEEEDTRLGNERFMKQQELLYYAFLYYHSGLYAQQVERYLRLFPRERVHIILYDDLKHAPLATVQEIYRFLGVDPDYEPALEVHNQSQFPLSVRLQKVLASRWRGHPLRPSQPLRRRDTLHIPVVFGINTLLGQYRTEFLRPATRHALRERFRPDIEKTAIVIGRNLDAWLADKPRAARQGAAVPMAHAG